MERVEKVLDDMGVNYKINANEAFVEFWTDTAGQDIPVDIEYDGTPEDFARKFSEYADAYDVDDEVEVYVGMRGKNGVPNTVRELMDSCQEAKDTLTEIAKNVSQAVFGKE